MFNINAKLLPAIIYICLILACNGTDNKSLIIKFSKDSTTISISNIDPAGLLQLKNNIDKDTMYQKLVSVLETPQEDDS